MSSPTDQPGANSRQDNTYAVQDLGNLDERTRVRLQDQMVTAAMGGVLPEQPDPTKLQTILDVGCGTGGWLIEVAKTYPGILHLVGVDLNEQMIEYAQKQAEAEQVAGRVQFRVMDARGQLDFPDASFDLVNQRFAMSFLMLTDWPGQLQKYQRLTRVGGVVRVSEADPAASTTSAALTRLFHLLVQAFFHAGRLLTPTSDGLTSQLPRLMQEAGLTQVQTCPHMHSFSAGTVQGQLFVEDMTLLFRTMMPFLQRWTQVPADYEQIYQQALFDIQQSEFLARGPMLTVWGKRDQLLLEENN
jgi:ubiquinone/menaquinone biosynthesis C-methylase UbiE